MTWPARDEVLDAYLEGVDAVVSIAARFDDDGWAQPSACAGWSARDLAGHLQIVAGWYHAWLDRAERRDAEPPFAFEALAEQNARALNALPDTSGPERIEAFERSAGSYATRLPDAWDLPFGAPPATVSRVPLTVGLHAGLAAAEWNLHAWDLGRAIGTTHEPVSARTIAAAIGTVFARAMPTTDVWSWTLQRSGRTSG